MKEKLKLNNSKRLFNEAKKIIPLASQTFSRSHLFFDKNFFPLFLKKGFGQYVYDLDKNKYLDFINGLGSVTIGYANQNIFNSITRETKKGNTFSLTNPIEVDLAKKLKKLIPSAEMVRYGKTGTDVNSAAIRLARFYTSKEHIAVCGYHGWHDWYIASTSMDGGIPKINKRLIHNFAFNNIESLKKIFLKKKIAAVIMEPFSYSLPNKNYLQEVRKICDKNKSLLIFDEICTGFRVSIGGAQSLYKVKPDISTFGKGIANGYPLSVIVGKKKIMKHMEKIFFSGTFGGEISSLAACKATIDFMQKNNVISKNHKKGLFLQKNIKKLLIENNLENLIQIGGHPSWLFLRVNEKSKHAKYIMLFIRQELIRSKILFLGSFNISYSHNIEDLKRVVKELSKIFSFIKENKDIIKKFVKIKNTKNLFQIRKN